MNEKSRRKGGVVLPASLSADVKPWSDLSNPSLYLNRELTWLAFNQRVLNEARDPRNPLMERLKFIAIVSSNLDEFFMKRIGGLKQQVGAGYKKLTVDGRSPKQQIKECVVRVQGLVAEKAELAKVVLEELTMKQIRILGYHELSREERRRLRENYKREVLPLITPLGLDSTHPFPFISNLSLNLLVTLSEANGDQFITRVKVPVGPNSPRFIRVGSGHSYIPLEEVVAHNLHLVFPDCGIESFELFRVTRNASSERNEEGAEDLLAMIEAELRDRKFAPTVRLEITEGMPESQRRMLEEKLGVERQTDVFENQVMLGMNDLMELTKIKLPELYDPPHHPVTNRHLVSKDGIFAAIRRKGSILLQFPKESFTTSVEQFLFEASVDPQVLAIKATLYRTSESTSIVSSLARAAQSGKHVAVLIELKARFDEAANVRWARRLEEAGVHVSFGVIGLKTHCKALLVVRREEGNLKQYVHVGTGNYHAGTARLYSDFGILSCDEALGNDISDFFNSLTSGRNVDRRYVKILTAPKAMKKVLLKKIHREISHHSPAQPGMIRLKTNALEDADIVAALYRASREGVKIELFVRDTCRLRPGLKGLSDTITVISTVSRFLEHARIYYFRNGGEEEYFLGSADLMQRNLEHRIELLVPIDDPSLRADLCQYLDTQRSDYRHLWAMQPDGTYVRSKPPIESEEHLRKECIQPEFSSVQSSGDLNLPRQNPGPVIMLVEPDPDLRSSIAELLAMFNYAIISAATGEQAMQLYEESNQSVAVLLVAAYMPAMSGIELINAMQQHNPQLPCLLLSALGVDALSRQTEEGTQVDYLTIPFTPNLLKNALLRVLAPPSRVGEPS